MPPWSSSGRGHTSSQGYTPCGKGGRLRRRWPHRGDLRAHLEAHWERRSASQRRGSRDLVVLRGYATYRGHRSASSPWESGHLYPPASGTRPRRSSVRALLTPLDSDPAQGPPRCDTAHVRYVDTTRSDTQRALCGSPRVPPPYGPTPRCADHSRRPLHTLPGRREPVASSQ